MRNKISSEATSQTDIYAFLTSNGIEFERFDHPPVFTCEEADKHVPEVSAAKTKNLFLRDKKGTNHFLVSVKPEKQVDLKSLAKVLEVNKLSLASPERLQKHLGLTPGSVTLLGAINDSEQNVEIIVDEELWAAEHILCHPLVNTSTLSIPKSGLESFFAATGHSVKVREIPGF